MKLISIIFIIAWSSFSCEAQDNLTRKMRKYHVQVETISGENHSGMVVNLDKDSVIFGPTWKSLHYSQVKRIRFKKKGTKGKAIMIGGITGAGMGLILGTQKSSGVEIKIIRSMFPSPVTLSLLGAGLGAMVKTSTNWIMVNGDPGPYREVVQKLENRERNGWREKPADEVMYY